jgi:hypothetical protein
VYVCQVNAGATTWAGDREDVAVSDVCIAEVVAEVGRFGTNGAVVLVALDASLNRMYETTPSKNKIAAVVVIVAYAALLKPGIPHSKAYLAAISNPIKVNTGCVIKIQ